MIEQSMGLAPRYRAKRLTADLTVADVDAVPVADLRADVLEGLFDPAEISTLDLNSVIEIGSAGRNDDALWYSFDMKGGSFLARPGGTKTVKQSEVSNVAAGRQYGGSAQMGPCGRKSRWL